MKNNQSVYGSFTCILVCWFMLLPFDYWLVDPILKIVQWPFEYLYLTFDPAALFETDTEGTFWLSVTAVALGFFVHFLITRIWKNALITKTHFQRISSVILSFFLIKYGWDKIILLQFYSPAPNILYTNFGWLSKDIAIWSLIGSSPGLSRAIGFLELSTGIFLLWPRFRFFGGFLSVFIFASIVVINFSFDISVKQLSLALFFWSCFLVASYPEKWKPLLGFRSEILTLQPIQNNVPKWMFAAYLILIVEGFSSTWTTGDFNFQNNSGPVPVSAFSINHHPLYAAVFTHPQGYVIIEYKNGKKQDFHIDNLDQFTMKNIHFKIGTLDLQSKTLILGVKKFSLSPLPIKQLPIQTKGWHFFSDSFH